MDEINQYAMLALGVVVAEILLKSSTYATLQELEVDSDVYVKKLTTFPVATQLPELFWMGVERSFNNHQTKEV